MHIFLAHARTSQPGLAKTQGTVTEYVLDSVTDKPSRNAGVRMPAFHLDILKTWIGTAPLALGNSTAGVEALGCRKRLKHNFAREAASSKTHKHINNKLLKKHSNATLVCVHRSINIKRIAKIAGKAK